MPSLLQTAVARRQPILAGGATDACRLLDGTGDELPGVFLDTLAGRLLLSTRSPEPPQDLLHELAATDPPLYHKRLDQHERESPAHLSGPPGDDPFLVRENGVGFEVSFASGYSQGIFLDQRDNRHRLHHSATSGSTVLNTFAYTGAFSVVAALAGATTTTLDLSQPYLDWARRNFAHNGIDPAAHHFCKGDTFHWLRRFARQGRRFDTIILDPPTFSRDARGKVFRAAKDYGRLAELAFACLADGGTLLCCTNCRSLPIFDLEVAVREAAGRPVDIDAAPMPADFRDTPYLKSLWVRLPD